MSTPRQRPPGRPVTVNAEVFFGVRLPRELADAVAAWAKARKITQSEAVRRILEATLQRDTPKG